jgi:hypothetical protein
MKQVDSITVTELRGMSDKMYGSLVKGVVDIRKEVLVVDAEMHVDQEQYLLEKGSKQTDLWGINLYPDKYGTDEFLEFDSMINIRPRQNNFSRDVSDDTVREKIRTIIQKVVVDD